MKVAIALSIASIGCLISVTVANAEPTRVCQYDPNLGVPNPLGMRSYITITEEAGNTTVLYEQFPSPIGYTDTPATIASSRELVFYATNTEDARQLMLQNPEYYSELVGYPDPEGFDAIDAVLTCSP